MKRIRYIIKCIATLVACIVLQGISSGMAAMSVTDSLYTQGNAYYMQREYAMAEQSYSRILALGYESGDLYYNLGNAFYKQEKYASAILFYEKALLLKPGDEDIRENLTLANARIIDKIDVIPDFFIKRYIYSIRGLFSPNQWAIVSLSLFTLGLLGLILFYASHAITFRKAGLSAGLTSLVLAVISFTLMFSRIHSILKQDDAIVMSPSVNARSSPDEQSTNVFVLHEGTKVMITDSVQNWKEIRIANGSTGWVQEEVLSGI